MRLTTSGNITEEEIDNLIQEETERFTRQGKELAAIEISEISHEELEVKSWAKSPIRRVRRITGYLSTVDRFNDGKQAELKDRVVHG